MQITIDIGFGKKTNSTIPTMRIPSKFEIPELRVEETEKVVKCWLNADTEIPSCQMTPVPSILMKHEDTLYEPYLMVKPFGSTEYWNYAPDENPNRFLMLNFLTKKDDGSYEIPQRFKLVHESELKNYGAAHDKSRLATSEEKKTYEAQYEAAKNKMKEKMVNNFVFIDGILHMKTKPPLFFLRKDQYKSGYVMSIGRRCYFDRLMNDPNKNMIYSLYGRLFSLTDIKHAKEELKFMNDGFLDPMDMPVSRLTIYDEESIHTDMSEIDVGMIKKIILDIHIDEIKNLDKERLHLLMRLKTNRDDMNETIPLIDEIISNYSNPNSAKMRLVENLKRVTKRIKNNMADNEIREIGFELDM